MKKKVTIIDYGAGNILSVFRAFEACSVTTEVTTDVNKIKNSSYLVLPGDGSFKFAARSLKKMGMFNSIGNHYKKGKPLMGICLGMQMLMSKSEEFGYSSGLSIIKGEVIKIKKQKETHLKIPVIGWNNIIINKSSKNKFNFNINSSGKKNFYFVHSYKAVPQNNGELIGFYNYGNEKITAIVGKENVIGTQFHPEKSGKDGINLLKNFLNY